ncbi:hypothetical protein [Ornithinimicrobium faecis]|uniref:hypothetical protein n=1 Tax=Ornithinimicrobium faecis TaxID=2934158 RepID=UPI0021188E1F|nr:hypothetical protein [Ornithinimicrobium sp. HY1745]
MDFLHADQVYVGQHVLYAGPASELGVADPDLVRRGHILERHHPGIVQKFYGPGLNHCVVCFAGLEEEPVSFAVGFDHEEDGHYPGLLVPSERAWEQALSGGWWASGPSLAQRSGPTH